jgi:hypothetical protein
MVISLLDQFKPGTTEGPPIGPGRREVTRLAERLQATPSTAEAHDA